MQDWSCPDCAKKDQDEEVQDWVMDEPKTDNEDKAREKHAKAAQALLCYLCDVEVGAVTDLQTHFETKHSYRLFKIRKVSKEQDPSSQKDGSKETTSQQNPPQLVTTPSQHYRKSLICLQWNLHRAFSQWREQDFWRIDHLDITDATCRDWACLAAWVKRGSIGDLRMAKTAIGRGEADDLKAVWKATEVAWRWENERGQEVSVRKAGGEEAFQMILQVKGGLRKGGQRAREKAEEGAKDTPNPLIQEWNFSEKLEDYWINLAIYESLTGISTEDPKDSSLDLAKGPGNAKVESEENEDHSPTGESESLTAMSIAEGPGNTKEEYEQEENPLPTEESESLATNTAGVCRSKANAEESADLMEIAIHDAFTEFHTKTGSGSRRNYESPSWRREGADGINEQPSSNVASAARTMEWIPDILIEKPVPHIPIEEPFDIVSRRSTDQQMESLAQKRSPTMLPLEDYWVNVAVFESLTAEEPDDSLFLEEADMFLADVESGEDEDFPSTEESESLTAISTEDPADGQEELSEDEMLMTIKERQGGKV